MSSINTSYDDREPNIRKAQFTISSTRIYTLDFDHNIQMQELKLMIQKAAHLKRKNFRLFSNGEEYTDYNEEIFDSLFPHQSLVAFTLEAGKDEEIFDETELLLQMNSPCPYHVDKFLLYYCFTCETSICSECFTNGIHKNHKIQDKCFYLLPSKYLVEKIFENWSQRPYEDYKISVNLSELKARFNNVMFDELFKMLKKVQEKCNSLIDEYNFVNQSSLGNIRDSVRDIKVSCIKALDNLKEELDIKNIVNNQQIFVEFDAAYKELGKLQNEKFKQNMLVFHELNKQVSILVTNLVQQIYSSIYNVLSDSLNEKKYENIKNQISQKFIKPADTNEIILQLSEFKKKRRSYIGSSTNNFVKNIANGVKEKFNSDQGKNIFNIPNNKKIINEFSLQDKDKTQNQNKKMVNSLFSSIPNTNKVKFGYVENSINQTNINSIPVTQTAKFGTNNISSISNNIENKQISSKEDNIFSNKIFANINSNINSSLNSNYGAQQNINIRGDSSNSYSSAQATRQVISTNIIPNINIDNQNLFSASSNRERNSLNEMSQVKQVVSIGSSSSNLLMNQNNQFGSNLNNNSETTMTKIIINPNNQQQIYNTINPTTTKNIQNTNINNKGNISQNTLLSYTDNSTLQGNLDKYINNHRKIIQEEFTESETDIIRPTDIRRFLNSSYILAPVTQTNSIKIITSDNREERTIPLKFPENFGFNIFFLDCAHCNCTSNKCLYVTGGIESTSEQKRSNVLLCVDITKPDELKVVKKSSMNYGRCGHTMVSEGKFVYVCGGEDSNSVERYDIENDVWEILPNMISKRMYPILYVHNGYLYAFFGKSKNNDYPCSIERLNISVNSNIKNPCWEMVIFSNQKNIDLRYYGCALHEINDLLYFFGGKCNEKTSDQIFFYNFESRFFEKEDSNVMWKEYFRENKLHQIGERLVQCTESKYFGIYLKLTEQ